MKRLVLLVVACAFAFSAYSQNIDGTYKVNLEKSDKAVSISYAIEKCPFLVLVFTDSSALNDFLKDYPTDITVDNSKTVTIKGAQVEEKSFPISNIKKVNNNHYKIVFDILQGIKSDIDFYSKGNKSSLVWNGYVFEK